MRAPARPSSALPTRRAFLGVLGAVGAVSLLTACSELPFGGTGRGRDGASSDAHSDAFGRPAQRDRAVMGSTERTTARVGLILGPPSMGLSRFLLAAEAGQTHHTFEVEVTGVDFATLAARFNQGDFDIVTLPSNIGAVLYNNTDIKTEVEVISVGNLGVLYGVTTDPGVGTLADLRGRTVYSIGQNGTPEYTIAAVLDGHGLSEEVDMAYRSTPFEVLNLLQNEPNAIAVLPQPFVELARTMVPSLHVPIDITQAWDAMPTNTAASQAVTTHTIVNRSFLEQHEAAVIEYLQQVGASVDFTLDNIAEAAAVQEKLGTFLNNDVAAAAMPFCSIVNLTGEVMHEALSGFLAAIHAQNPAAVGGKLPGGDFYYMPPIGALDADVRELVGGLDPAERRS
ncbi:hypothetical protein [Leucobacter albus]|uniref:NitT/TauT family transport system substrate-binding protein n=1 Tax=Leucobacter albus TaxID=272210 RepID=A0ABW3TR39_9MICO